MRLGRYSCIKVILVVTVVPAMATCGHRNIIPAQAATILELADHFELLSLVPHIQLPAAEGDFHGYKVLDRIVVTDRETREKLVSAFKKAVEENQGPVAACFNPRHGIRVTQNEKWEDFVICFQCDNVQAFGAVQAEFKITNSAEPLFEAVLRMSNVTGTK